MHHQPCLLVDDQQRLGVPAQKQLRNPLDLVQNGAAGMLPEAEGMGAMLGVVTLDHLWRHQQWRLARGLDRAGVPIWGTSQDAIDRAEDRERFGDLMKKLGLKAPAWGIARSLEQAKQVEQADQTFTREGLTRALPDNPANAGVRNTGEPAGSIRRFNSVEDIEVLREPDTADSREDYDTLVADVVAHQRRALKGLTGSHAYIVFNDLGWKKTNEMIPGLDFLSGPVVGAFLAAFGLFGWFLDDGVDSPTAMALVAAIFIWGTYMGAYHAGIEWKFWAGPQDCSGPINRLDQVFAHPQIQHRGMRIDLPHPVAGRGVVGLEPVAMIAYSKVSVSVPPLPRAMSTDLPSRKPARPWM